MGYVFQMGFVEPLKRLRRTQVFDRTQFKNNCFCSNSAAYTSGVLGVRRTPGETEYNVTFSSWCDQGKITKNTTVLK